MWHAGTGLPWDWRIGPADSSERAHMRAMLEDLPAAAMLAADAGFVGYEGMWEVQASGRRLLLRVGSNVRLLKQLGYVRERESIVYLWPEEAARRGRPRSCCGWSWPTTADIRCTSSPRSSPSVN